MNDTNKSNVSVETQLNTKIEPQANQAVRESNAFSHSQQDLSKINASSNIEHQSEPKTQPINVQNVTKEVGKTSSPVVSIKESKKAQSPQTVDQLEKHNVDLQNKQQEVENNAEKIQPIAQSETVSSEINEKSIKIERATSTVQEPQSIVSEVIEKPIQAAEVVISQPEYVVPQGSWNSQYEAIVGLSHRKTQIPVPCQDAAYSSHSLRPVVIVADGAGSSAVSDIGSNAVVTGLARFLDSLNVYIVTRLLDNDSIDENEIRNFALILVKHAKGILDDLAVQYRREQKDFRCTLLLAVVGKCKTMWLKVGDGALVIEKLQKTDIGFESKLTTLGEVGKGQYANATQFIDNSLNPHNDVQFGLFDSENLVSIMAMSDGAAERFVSNDGCRVAGSLSNFTEKLRNNKLSRQELTTFFYSDSFRKNAQGNIAHSGDDCSIALASRSI